MRVLVVDDNMDCADAVAMILKSLGCDVKCVYDFETALDTAKVFLPELALIDVMICDRNGYVLAKALRARPENSELNCVALTGWSEPAYLERSRQEGFFDHLVKPVGYDQLEALLQRLVKADSKVESDHE